MTVRLATPADAMDIAYIHVDTWQSAYRGMIPDTYLDTLSLSQRGNWWLKTLTDPDDPTFVFVALDDQGQPVGFVEGGPQRNKDIPIDGELYAIYVLKQNQGQGHGRDLFLATVRELHKQNINNMILWVLKDNAPARRFYESMGGELTGEQQFDLAGTTLTEVATSIPTSQPS
ncbi:MAG: GNAT family N-acetyltransferase [Chloroflexia bacterium]